MTNPIDALQQLQNDLIRKTLNGSVFLAPDSADVVDEADLFDPSTGDLVSGGLPAGYGDLGYLTDAGAAFSRAVSQSDVNSWQSQTPTRSDSTSDITTLAVACQETKLATIGLYLNVDPADISAGANGVVAIDQPKTPKSRFYRVLSVAVDEQDDGEIVICRFLPRAQPTAFDNQSFAKGDDPILWPVTFTGRVDDAVGTSGRYIFGGAGWRARLAAMGFTSTPSVPAITSASPTALNTAGGQLVQINGRGFTGTVVTTGVKFAGTNATAWDVVDDSTIVAVAPAHAAGSGPIVVTNATGPSTTGPTVTYS